MKGLRAARLVLPVLAIVCAALAAPLLAVVLPCCPPAYHHEGGHCPGSGADGTPCVPGCPCLGCHAQVQVAVAVDPGLLPGAPAARRAGAVPTERVPADDPVRNVFHPPRLAASA